MKRIVSGLLLLLPVLSQAQIITTVAGTDIFGYTGNGAAATAARLSYPSTIALDGAHNVYFSDKNNNVIRKINPSGIVTTVAGNGFGAGYGSLIDSGGYSGDGGPAILAEFRYPWAVASDVYGNLYIADRGNNVVRKIFKTGIIITFAGNGYGAGLGAGYGGYSGDGGPADSAELYFPSAVAVDHIGNVYIGDSYNNVIRKVDTFGVITTFAGNHAAGYGGDGGPANAASLNDPYGIAIGPNGDVYIADRNNAVIRKVDTTGTITTFAGDGTYGYNGDGGPATAAESGTTDGVATDDSGNVYFADINHSVIRKVNTSGIISTYAGNGTPGYSGDGGLATSAQLDYPLGLAVSASGDVYIADDSSSTIRLISPGATGVIALPAATGFQLFPNPVDNELNITCTYNIATITIINLLGQVVYRNNNSPQLQIDVSGLPAGVYFIKANGSEIRKFVKE